MAKKTENMIMCLGHNTEILKCNGMKQESEFINSWSKFHPNGKIPYCKDCINKMLNYYMGESGDFKSSLFYVCQKTDTPFIKDVYENLIELNKLGENGQGRKFALNFGNYVSLLHKRTTFMEVLQDFSMSDCDLTTIDNKLATKDLKEKELQEFKDMWGEQESVEDYLFLQSTYNRYTKEIEELSVQQEDLYRDLCRDRLLLRKLSESGLQDNDMITKVQARVQGLMKTLKLDNFEGNQKRTLSEQSFIEKIKLIEETKPLEVMAKEDKNKYVDYNHRKQYYTDLVLRPLCNTLAGHKDFNIDMSDLNKYSLEGDK